MTLTDKKLLNIREDIEANNLVQIGARKEIYAGKNNVSFRYYDGTKEEDVNRLLVDIKRLRKEYE